MINFIHSANEESKQKKTISNLITKIFDNAYCILILVGINTFCIRIF